MKTTPTVIARYFRRLTFALLSLLAIWILIYGPRRLPADPKGRVVIQYWEKWTGWEGDAMHAIVEDFNNTVGAEKGILVQYLAIATVDKKTLVATAAGVPPDIAGFWDNTFFSFAAMGALEPLDDLCAEYGISAATFKPAYWVCARYHGHQYALVSTPAAPALIWNKKFFQESAAELRAAGLDPNRPPASIAELDRYAEVLDRWKTTPDGRRILVRTGHHPLEPGWYLQFTSYWWNQGLFDEKTQRLTLDAPGVISAFEWIGGYSKRLGVDAATEFKSGFGSFQSSANPFFTGGVAIIIQGPWMERFIQQFAPEMNHVLYPEADDSARPLDQRRANRAWAVAPFPNADPSTGELTFAGCDLIGIPRGAKHKKEAFEFIAYLQRQDVAEKLGKLQCKPTSLARVSPEFLHTHPNPYIDVYDRLLATPRTHAGPPLPIWAEVQKELEVAWIAVFRQEKTPAQALGDAQRRMQRRWEEYQQLTERRRKVFGPNSVP